MIRSRLRFNKRELRMEEALLFLQDKFWPQLFEKKADSLEISMDNPNDYMIVDNNPITDLFASSSEGGVSPPAVFIGGIVGGALHAMAFVSWSPSLFP